MYSLAFAVKGSRAEAIQQTPLHKLKVWCHPVNVKLFCPARVSAGIYSSFYWSRLQFTDCGLKPLMQPSLCLHLLSSSFQSLSLHILHFPPTLHPQMMFGSFTFTLHLLFTLTTPFSFPSFSFILLPFFSPSWRCFHSSGSYFIFSFFHCVPLSFPSLSLILLSFPFFSCF